MYNIYIFEFYAHQSGFIIVVSDSSIKKAREMALASHWFADCFEAEDE